MSLNSYYLYGCVSLKLKSATKIQLLLIISEDFHIFSELNNVPSSILEPVERKLVK
jgi:hypothetical protein